MKSGWQTKSLGDVCQVIGGGTPSKDKAAYYVGDIPWATVRDMRSEVISETECNITKEAVKSSSTNIIPGGNVVIATRVGLGKVCLLAQDTAINQDLRGIIPNDRQTLSVRFLFSWLKSVAHLIVAEGTGATVQGVKLPFVKSLQVPLPLLPEQQRIVGILDEAFDGIATAKANFETNLQNARALFESHLQSVFTERGEGFEETTLGKVCEFIGGSQPPKAVFEKERTADNVRLIQIRDYKTDKHVVYIPRSMARRFCDADEVMIGRYGPPLFQILRGLDGAYNVALMKAVPDESKLSRDYLFYFLKHSDILQYVIYHSARAAGQIGITKETLEPYPIALPSHENQKRVVATIMELGSETQHLESLYQQKLTALDDLKKSLLHQAFSGAL